jgi:hypothetical protein
LEEAWGRKEDKKKEVKSIVNEELYSYFVRL